MLLTERRIAEGVEFWKKYRRTLERAEREYGVPPEYVVAIIGVETFYGRNTGSWRVVDALTTLAFDYPPRADFFRSELEQYLLFARDAGIDVFSVRGSYAGAIGIPQFMPAQRARATRSTSTATARSTCARAAPTRSAAWPISSRCTAGSATPTVLLAGARRPARPGAPTPTAHRAEAFAWPSCARPACEFDSPQPAGAPVALIELTSAERAERLPRRAAQLLRAHPLQPQRVLRHRGRRPRARQLRKNYDLGK